MSAARFDIRPPTARAAGIIELWKMITLARKDAYGRAPEVFAEEQASPAVRDVFRRRVKAAVDPGTTTDADYASQLSYRDLSDDFVTSLRNISLFDTIRPLSVQLPADTSIAVSSSTGVGSATGEGLPKAISDQQWGLAAPTMRKVVWLGAVNDEVLRAPLGERALTAEARSRVAVGGDTILLADLEDGAVDHGASGITSAAAYADLRTAVKSILTGAGSVIVGGMPSSLLKSMALMTDSAGAPAFPDLSINGGSIGGIVFVPIDAAEMDSSGGVVTLVDATQLATVDLGVTVRTSRQATLQMDNAPDSPPNANTVYRSMFQNNQTAILIERLIAFAKIRSGIVARIVGANYGG